MSTGYKADDQAAEHDKLYQIGDLGLDGKAFKFEKTIKDPEAREAWRALVIEAITEGIKVHCRMPISSKEAQQMRFVVDSLKMLGDGDLHSGIDVAIENHKAVKEYRTWLHETSAKVGRWVIIGVLSTIAGLTVIGVKVILNRTP